jgi:hypothetical protein
MIEARPVHVALLNVFVISAAMIIVDSRRAGRSTVVSATFSRSLLSVILMRGAFYPFYQ